MLCMSGIDFIFHTYMLYSTHSVFSCFPWVSRCIITEPIINDKAALSSTNFSSCFIALVKVLQTYEDSSDRVIQSSVQVALNTYY